jgi:hypothetical protein
MQYLIFPDDPGCLHMPYHYYNSYHYYGVTRTCILPTPVRLRHFQEVDCLVVNKIKTNL